MLDSVTMAQVADRDQINKLTMSEKELIEDINNEITFSGALPYSLPEKEIKRIIENDCRYFWDNYLNILMCHLI